MLTTSVLKISARRTLHARSMIRRVGATHPTTTRYFSTEKNVPERAPSRLRQWWDDGTILLSLGFSSLFLVAVDRFLQYQNKLEVTDTVEEIRHQVDEKRREMMERYQNSPTLFQCKVVEEYKMGGSHGLKGVKVGDVVEILQEDVGPGEYYHLCRTRDPETADVLSIGWYPLETKMDVLEIIVAGLDRIKAESEVAAFISGEMTRGKLEGLIAKDQV